MIQWMLWSLGLTLLMGVAALAVERVAAYVGLPRRFAWLAAIAAAVVLPPFVATRRAHGGAGVVEDRVEVVFTDGAAPATIPIAPGSDAVVPPRAAAAEADVSAGAGRWVAPLWLLASALVATGFLRALVALRRRSRRWPESAFGEYRALVSPDAGPAVIGFARPRIVIPEWALTLDPHDRELMLRHEAEHIRAGDPRALFAAGIALVAFPWNAGLWWMVRQFRRAMEFDCDARVLRAVGGPHDYGMMLLAVGERRIARMPLAASLSAPRPLLERRIDAMTTPRPVRPLRASLPLIVCAVLALTAATRVPRPAALDASSLWRRATPPETVATPVQATPPSSGAVAPTKAPVVPRLASAPSAPQPSAAPTAVPPQTTPASSRAGIIAITGAHFPEIARGDVDADYLVLVFDSAGAYVWGTHGKGSSMIGVEGDTMTLSQRHVLEADRRAELAGAAAKLGGAGAGAGAGAGVGGGGGGRGGRGGGSALTPVDPTVPRKESYSTGTMIGGKRDSSGKFTPTPMNDAPGLEPFSRGSSGIVGIPASQVVYVDIFSFTNNEIAPYNMRVLAVHLNVRAPSIVGRSEGLSGR